MSTWPQSIARVIRRTERPAARVEESIPATEPALSAVASPAPVVEIPPNDPIVAYFQSAPGAVDLDGLELDSPALEELRAGRRQARRPAREPGRARRAAQPRPATVRPGLLDRRPQAPELARRAGGSCAPGRAARAKAGSGGAVARADRAGATRRDADPAELPAEEAPRPAGLGGVGLLPAGARGRRRLLRLRRAAGRPNRPRDRRRHRQGRPGRDGDGGDPKRASRLGAARRLARRGARARQRAHVPGHAGEDVRHLPLRRARAGDRPLPLRERRPQPSVRPHGRGHDGAAGDGHAARADARHSTTRRRRPSSSQAR